jgi:putative ABC transport system permease protein
VADRAHGAKLAVGGLLVGLGLFVAMRRLLAGQLYGISSSDPLTLGTVAGLLLVTLAATLVPALRALRIGPAAALRQV